MLSIPPKSHLQMGVPPLHLLRKWVYDQAQALPVPPGLTFPKGPLQSLD